MCMRITHDEGIDLNKVKMTGEELDEAFSLLPACLVDKVVESVLDDLIEQAHEEDDEDMARTITATLNRYRI